MSQMGRFLELENVETLTGNSGGAVGPDGSQNINILGDEVGVTVVGNPGTNTLTITTQEEVPVQFDTDSGSAIPAANVLNIIGGDNIATSGATNVVTVAVSGTTDHAVQIGNASGSLNSITVGTDGQVIVGATGADPAFATLTSADASVVFATGANTLDLTVDIAAAGGVVTLTGDSGGAISPTAGGDIGIAGGINITTAGSGNTITINLDDAISLATSVTSPLYTVASGDLVLNMADDAGTDAVSFTNDSDAEVAYVDSLGAASFTELDVDNINIDGNTIISTDTDGDITLTPDGSGAVNISYLTQYTLPIAGASGAIQDLADGLGSSGQVLTSGGPGVEPSWEDTAVAFTWNVETTTPIACAVNNGYFANYAGTLAFTLPTTAAVGDTIQICQMAAGQGWTLAVNTGETIYIGNTNTTVTTGTLASTDDGDWIELVCRVANTDWACNVKSGNISVT